MHWRKVSSLLALVAFSAQADGFKYIPKWSIMDTVTGKMACYNMENALQLAKFDLDLQAYDILQTERTDYDKTIIALTAEANLEKTKADALEAQRDALTASLRESEAARIKAENNTSGTVGWIVASGVGLVAVGLVVALVVVTKK